MGELESAHGSHAAAQTGSVSVPTVIGIAVLIGAGLFGTAYWLITDFSWLWFASLGAVVLGAYLLFTRGTGPDHA